jgi:hypothetical protein
MAGAATDSVDMEDTDNDLKDTLGTLLALDFVEHDSFSIFEAVMKYMKVKFETKQTTDCQAATVLARSSFVQNELLKTIDPPLFRHFSKLEIAPQIYGLYAFLCHVLH